MLIKSIKVVVTDACKGRKWLFESINRTRLLWIGQKSILEIRNESRIIFKIDQQALLVEDIPSASLG